MIVRTAPVTWPPSPIHAKPKPPRREPAERCGAWMPRANAVCARKLGHKDVSHRPRSLMDEETARRRVGRHGLR